MFHNPSFLANEIDEALTISSHSLSHAGYECGKAQVDTNSCIHSLLHAPTDRNDLRDPTACNFASFMFVHER